MKAKVFHQFIMLFIVISTLLTLCSTRSYGPISCIPILVADDTVSSEGEFLDYCSDFSAFAERFVRPAFPENAQADEQKSWYALKKTCGRDLIKLSTSKWPTFDVKPNDVKDDDWDKFIAQEELGRFRIGEAIFDENHGGTLIKKYYCTDYEPDKIIALSQIAEKQVSMVKELISTLTQDDEWKALRNCEIDFFLQDFRRWFIPYCHASLSKIPPIETFSANPDLFLSTADLLEFAVDFISDSDDFTRTLDGVSELIKSPNAKEIRVFHGRYEGFELISRDVVFKRYCDRIAAIEKKRLANVLKPELVEGSFFNNRQTERFEHSALPQWGGKNPNQRDYFYIVFPKRGPKDDQPLYVVLHSAGHSAKAALECTREIGNHDVYHVPEDFYGLFLDCFDNRETDWWWGGRRTDQPEITDELSDRSTSALTPVEKRILDEIAWVIDKFRIDPNRVYLCGNSMGGSGTLGIGLANGDVFAAIKSNVPAGIWHAYDRLQLSHDDAPSRVVDPPVCFDYSSPVDSWSKYHEELFKGLERRKYSYIAYWGNFGHENNDERVAKYNDLFNTFDWTSIRKDRAYPVFTSVSSDSSIPWPACSDTSPAGQRGAYFRWENIEDSSDVFEMTLRLASVDELQTKIFDVPISSTADVSIRRLQHFKIAPNETLSWEFGTYSGKANADKNGLFTIPKLIIKTEPQLLRIFR